MSGRVQNVSKMLTYCTQTEERMSVNNEYGGPIGYQLSIPASTPQEYKEHARKNAEREVGTALLKAIKESRSCVVVEYDEMVTQEYYQYELRDVLRIIIRLMPVEYRHVTAPVFEGDTAYWTQPNKRLGLLARIKKMLKR